jgi:hypothetical protein
MVRVRLALGEEAVYRTVEELALGISSGIITEAAEVYDPGRQTWVPITGHPEYQRAVSRAATLTATAELEPELTSTHVAPAAIRVEAGSGAFQIYQMFSRSAAELQARRRPRWLLPTATVVAGAAMVVTLAFSMRRERAALQHAAPPPVVARPRPLADTVSVVAPTQPRPSVRLAPINLAARRTLAMNAAAIALSDSASRLGLRELLSPARLLFRDSVELTQRALSLFRNQLERYRGALRRTEQTYRDSAAGLLGTGLWSRTDDQEWRFRIAPVETQRDAVQADSLLTYLDRLFGLLRQETGQYEYTAKRATFATAAAGVEYDRVRAGLIRHSVNRSTAWAQNSTPLMLLLRGVGGASLAPLQSANP